MDIHSVELGWCMRVRCEKSWRLDAAWSERLRDCDLWYVWGGRGEMQLRDRTLELRPGVCLWMRPEGHYFAQHDTEDPLCVTAIHFTPRDSSGNALLKDAELPGEVHFIQDTAYFNVVTSKIVMLHRRGDADARAHACLLLRGLLLELLSVKNNGPDASNRYRAHLESQIAKIYEQPVIPWKVSDLASEMRLSPDHYTRVFRQISGSTPRALIQDARLQRACQMLLETSLSVSEIAEQTGYADVYQFSKLFKRHMKLAPSRWRTESRQLPS